MAGVAVPAGVDRYPGWEALHRARSERCSVAAGPVENRPKIGAAGTLKGGVMPHGAAKSEH